MSELADEADSKSVGGNVVWVQVPLPAVHIKMVSIKDVDRCSQII